MNTWEPPSSYDTWSDQRLAQLEDDVALLERRLRDREGPSARYLELLGQKRRLEAELAGLLRREAALELDTDRERRRLAAEVKRLRRRADRGPSRGPRSGGRRATRSAHIEVDPAAWAVLKRSALERRQLLADVLTTLVTDEVSRPPDGAAANPSRRRRRSPGEGEANPQARVVRLSSDDDSWHRLRLAADAAGLPLGRYLGEIIEYEARRHGWRAAKR
jgi:hypothetical protein